MCRYFIDFITCIYQIHTFIIVCISEGPSKDFFIIIAIIIVFSSWNNEITYYLRTNLKNASIASPYNLYFSLIVIKT
jgi:hypothetical protein